MFPKTNNTRPKKYGLEKQANKPSQNKQNHSVITLTVLRSGQFRCSCSFTIASVELRLQFQIQSAFSRANLGLKVSYEFRNFLNFRLFFRNIRRKIAHFLFHIQYVF